MFTTCRRSLMLLVVEGVPFPALFHDPAVTEARALCDDWAMHSDGVLGAQDVYTTVPCRAAGFNMLICTRASQE